MCLVFQYFPNFSHLLITFHIFAVSDLYQGSVNFSCTGPEGLYFQLHGPGHLCWNHLGAVKAARVTEVSAMGVAMLHQNLTDKPQATDRIVPGPECADLNPHYHLQKC